MCVCVSLVGLSVLRLQHNAGSDRLVLWYYFSCLCRQVLPLLCACHASHPSSQLPYGMWMMSFPGCVCSMPAWHVFPARPQTHSVFSRCAGGFVCRVDPTLRCCRCLLVPEFCDGCSSGVVKLCVGHGPSSVGRVFPGKIPAMHVCSGETWVCGRSGSRRGLGLVLAVCGCVHRQQSSRCRHSSPVSVCRRLCASSDCVQGPP